MTDTNITSIVTTVRAHESIDFLKFTSWLVKLMMACTLQKNFWSVEILAPDEKDSDWTIVQRFATRQDALNWKEAEPRAAIIAESTDEVEMQSMILSDEISHHGSAGTVATAINTEIKPGMLGHYQEWQTRIQQLQVASPGFKGIYLSPERDNLNLWTAVVRFDSPEAVEGWLANPQREQLLEESKQFVEARHIKRLTSSFPGWFPEDDEGKTPPKWKTATLILISLMPMALLLRYVLAPHLTFLHSAVNAAVSTILTLCVVTYVVMPFFVKLFRWWLIPKSESLPLDLKGLSIVTTIFVIEVATFVLLFPE